jgi:hypothetical protein
MAVAIARVLYHSCLGKAKITERFGCVLIIVMFAHHNEETRKEIDR